MKSARLISAKCQENNKIWEIPKSNQISVGFQENMGILLTKRDVLDHYLSLTYLQIKIGLRRSQ